MRVATAGGASDRGLRLYSPGRPPRHPGADLAFAVAVSSMRTREPYTHRI